VTAANAEATAGRDGRAEPYASFWQAGFEGADHINGSAEPLCMNSATGHIAHARGDYARLAKLHLRTARESAGWRSVERGGRFDFSSIRYREQCARDSGVQLLWTLFHYGVPDGLDIFSDGFVARFADYCHAFARCLKPFYAGPRPPVYTPINEISFLSWAVCETGLIHPHRGERPADGYQLKKHLVRATIAACDAIREADPRARILAVDPLIHVVAGERDQRDEAALQNEYQFQAWDMLAGRLEPQLGGGARYLDLIGVNYYPHNQWEAVSRRTLPWPHDPRRTSLSALLMQVYRRYGRPITISETSHVGEDRAAWIGEVAGQVRAAQERGADIRGICLYPAIDRPDWERPDEWHRSGLWHVHERRLRRRLNISYAHALHRAQHITS
jgi:UDP-galactopyranose mutase